MSRYLGIIALLLIPLLFAGASPSTNWYDALELPSSPQIDVKYLGVQVSGSDLILSVEMHSYSDPKPDYYTGRIFLDMKPGGETSGDIRGADYQIAFHVNPSNSSDRGCVVLAYDDVKLQWEESKTLSCSAQISGGKIMISGRDFGRYMSLASFKLKAYFDSLGKVIYEKAYSLSNSGKAMVDGEYGEYKIPLTSKQPGGTFSIIDYREIYALDDLSRLYLALAPSSSDGISCSVRGINSRLSRNYFVEIYSDRKKGADLTAAYTYLCTPEGRRWYPYAAYAGSGEMSIGKAVELSVRLLPALAKLGGGFDLVLRVTFVYRDSVPDSGWISYGSKLPEAKEFEVTGTKVDVEMNKDLSKYFKSVGSASGILRIGLGGPAADPSYSAGVRFLKGSDGLYRGVEFNGKSYWASYGQRDYAVVRVVKIGEGYYCSAAGVTRYGTRAGLIWLANNIQLLSPGSAYLIGWTDDGDGIVEPSEIILLDQSG